eukprot:8234572-Pyramimonas_sp.AAC.1
MGSYVSIRPCYRHVTHPFVLGAFRTPAKVWGETTSSVAKLWLSTARRAAFIAGTFRASTKNRASSPNSPVVKGLT